MPKLGIGATMNKQERKWRAEEDARAIARAKEIQDDPQRMKEASKAAKSIVTEKQKCIEEQQEELAGLKKLAKKAR